MSVSVIDGIGYSKKTKAAYLVPTAEQTDGKKFSVPQEGPAATPTAYAYWGPNNDLPDKMAKDIECTPVLAAALDAKPRIAVGKGITPFYLISTDPDGKEQLEAVRDPEMEDFFEMNDSFGYSINSCYDLFGYGWTVSQLLLSRNRKKINRIKRTDVVECRLEKKDKSGIINNVYLSDDWQCNNQITSEYVKKIPILNEGAELYDLVERSAGYEFSIINRNMRNGKSYYPPPLWYSGKHWVDIAKSVPKMKTALFNNQMTIKYLVTISMNYWKRIHQKWDTYTPEKRKQLMDDKLNEIDKYLTGNENQYKSIFANSYIDPVTKQEVADIKIDVLDDKVKDGKLLPDSAAANSEILFALNINPALFGAGQPEGAYSNNAGGSNIREAFMMQLMLLEWERRQNARIFNVVKKYNGWSDRLEAGGKKLVFRYPSGLLTTLDTGKSTKPEVM
jgi:hypothetical protein